MAENSYVVFQGGQPLATKKFDCKNPTAKEQDAPVRKHRVKLSWKASVSLSTPLGDGEGYNVYRLNQEGICTQLNQGLIRETEYTDKQVEVGKGYRYAATAVKQGSESGFSEPADVSIPEN